MLGRKRMTALERNQVLSEVGRTLQDLATERFAKYDSQDQRGAALWDAANYVVEQMGDGNWLHQPTSQKESSHA